MHTCGYSEHQENELNVRKRFITRLLFILFLIYILKCLLAISKRNPRIFLFFVYEILCRWSTSEIWWKRYEGDRRYGNFYIEVLILIMKFVKGQLKWESHFVFYYLDMLV